jgi:hypothetical protein
MRRMRRVLGIALLLLSVSAAGGFAAGGGSLRLGLEFGDPTAVIIIRPGAFNFKVGYDLRENGNLFVSADYRIISGYQLVDFLHFFLGLGAYMQIYFNGSTPLDLGMMIPVGLQVFLLDSVLELFVEVAPTVGFLPEISAFRHWLGYAGFTLRVGG